MSKPNKGRITSSHPGDAEVEGLGIKDKALGSMGASPMSITDLRGDNRTESANTCLTSVLGYETS